MNRPLEHIEIRIVGSLVEKQVTTPEYYPLTLNALVAACNQTTNRDPVMSLMPSGVESALERLREQNLVWVVRAAGSRVLKYEHRLGEQLGTDAAQTALLCVLMLRGPQTIGELRGRTGRLHEFASLEAVEATLSSLQATDPPRVVQLPRAPGTKEPRFAHCLGEPVSAAFGSEPASGVVRMGASASASAPAANPVADLRAEVESLREQLAALREEFLELKRQLE